MPAQRIEYDGKVHEFPDDFSQSDIAKALKTYGQPAAPPVTPDLPHPDDVAAQTTAAARTLAEHLTRPAPLPTPTPGMKFAPPSYQIGLDDPTAPLPRGAMPVSLLKRVPGTETYRGPVRMPAVGFEDPTARPYLNVPGSKPEGERMAGAAMNAPSVSMTRQVLETPLITAEDIDENFPFLVGPFRLHAGMLKAGAAMTTPENAAVTVATGGLGAVRCVTAAVVRGGLSAYFATGAGKALKEKYPQIKDAVKAKDWQGALELGGGALADAPIIYGAGKHAAGEIFKRAPAEARANYVRKMLGESQHRATAERERVHSSAPTSPLNLRDPKAGVAPEPQAPEAPAPHEIKTPAAPEAKGDARLIYPELKSEQATNQPAPEPPAPSTPPDGQATEEKPSEPPPVVDLQKVNEKPQAAPASEHEVERRATEAVQTNKATLAETYRKKFGNEINTDNAREIVSPEYASSREERTRLSGATQKPAGELADHLYAEALRNPDPEKPPSVVITAGGPGSGKTTAVRSFSSAADSQFVYDSNLSVKSSSVAKIEAAKEPGHRAHVIFTLRDPVEGLTGGTLPRAMDEGRIVNLEAHARLYRDAARNFSYLLHKYAGDPQVSFTTIDNSRGVDGMRVMPLEKMADIRYSTKELLPRLRAALDKEYAAGRISESVYRATLGTSGPEAAGDVPRDPGPGGAPSGGEGPFSAGLRRDTDRVLSGEPQKERSGTDEPSAAAQPGSLSPSAPEPSASIPEPDPAAAKPTTLASGFGALQPYYDSLVQSLKESAAEASALNEKRRAAVAAAKAGQPTELMKEIGRTFRQHVTGERDLWGVRINQVIAKLRRFLPDPVEQEALSLMRDFKSRPGELAQFLSGSHPDLHTLPPDEYQVAMEQLEKLRPAIEKALNPTPKMLVADGVLTRRRYLESDAGGRGLPPASRAGSTSHAYCS